MYSKSKAFAERKSSKGQRKLQRLLTVALSPLILFSCTAELPYKPLLKEDTFKKSIIDENADYLYMPSNENVSRTAPRAFSYYMGDTKLVRFKFEKDALKVYEIEKDERFSENPANLKQVLEIPITHVEYRCREDRYGECQNEEEQNNEITWDKKTEFKADFGALSVVENSYLPTEIGKVFGRNCYTPKTSRLLDYELTETDLNIRIERSYDVDFRCLGFIRSLSDTTATLQYQYSFARADSLASANYEVAEYPPIDEQTFGFFSTDVTRKSVDFQNIQAQEKNYINRWNPKRSDIVFYLSPEFKKPSNKLLREAAFTSVETVNNGLRQAGVRFKIKLEDAPENMRPGDIRHSMIVLVEDPYEYGSPGGYGPSSVNPKTGEIVSARTIMFSGAMRSAVQMTYDLIYSRYKAAQIQELKDGKSEVESNLKLQKLLSEVKKAEEKLAAKIKGGSTHTHKPVSASKAPVAAKDALKQNNVEAFKRHLENLSSSSNLTSDLEDRLELLSKYNYYPTEFINMDRGVVEGVLKVLKGKMRPWDNLTDGEKESIINVALPPAFISTLVHEIGHNLGLRHNFSASTDEENFYTKEELAGMGIFHEIPYASVMDYPYTKLNQLRTMGKYDIAALRYGYNRQVEVLVDGKSRLVSLSGSIQNMAKNVFAGTTAPSDASARHSKMSDWTRQQLKRYAYCTDEHVAVNANCNRFDEGVTRTDIVKNMIIQNYEGLYYLRNTRAGQSHFSMLGDLGYIYSIKNLFTTLRLNFENYASAKNDFRLTSDSPEWTEVPWLADLREASRLSAYFFLDVIKTPDITCGVINDKNPGTIDLVPLSVWNKEALNCEDVPLNPGFHHAGQAGYAFNSIKSEDNPSTYLDQIDVRGRSYDKVLALEALLNRRLGMKNFDDTRDNFLDLPEVADDIVKTIEQVLFNDISGELILEKQDGEINLLENIRYSLAPSPVIETPLDARVSSVLDLRETDTPLADQFLHIVQREVINSPEHRLMGDDYKEHFSVITQNVTENTDLRNAWAFSINSTRYVALPQHKVASRVIQSIYASMTLPQLPPEKVQEIYKARLEGNHEIPEGTGQPEVFLYMVDFNILSDAVQGGLAEPAYYLNLLQVMGDAR